MDKLRHEIDTLHLEMAALFLKRLQLTEQIWVDKLKQRLPLTDAQREAYLIHMLDHIDELKENPQLRNAYHKFVKNLIEVNKQYLCEINNITTERENEK